MKQNKKSPITLKSATLLSTAIIAGNSLMGPITTIANAAEMTEPTTNQASTPQTNEANVVKADGTSVTEPTNQKTEDTDTGIKNEIATPKVETQATNEVKTVAEDTQIAHVTALLVGPDGQSLGSVNGDVNIAGTSTDLMYLPTYKGLFVVDDFQDTVIRQADGSFTINNEVLHEGENVITINYSHTNMTGNITITDDTTGALLETFNVTQLSDGSPMVIDGTETEVDTEGLIRSYESKGYEFVSSDVPPTLTDPSQTTYFNIHLKHGMDEKVSHKEVKRTVNLQKANGEKIDSKTQSHSFVNTVVTDKVLNKVVSDTWSENEFTFDAIDLDNLFGYTLDKGEAGPVTVTPSSQDITGTATYTPNKETAKVVFKDVEDNKVLSEQTITGDFDTKSDFNAKDKISDYVSKNLVLVENQVKDGINFDFDGETKTFVVSFKHKHTVTTENKDVNRTVNFKNEAGETVAKSVKQHARFTQTKDRDEFTGKTSFSGWEVSEGARAFEAINVDKVYGFSTDETNFPAVIVDENTKSETHDVVYHANDETITVKFLDTVTGKEIAKPEVLEGKFGETAKLTSDTIKTLVNAEGYSVQANPFDKGVTFDVDGETKVVTIKFGHQMNSESIDRTVKRNFHLVNAETNKVMKEITQSITFTKTITADLVTGEITETEWASKDKGFAAVNMPTIKGFTAEKTKFAAEKVDPMQVDKDITVLYTPVKEVAKPEQKPGKGTTTDVNEMGDVVSGTHTDVNAPSKGITTDANEMGDVVTNNGEITPESKAQIEATPNTEITTPEATDNEDVQTSVESNNFGVIGAIMAASASLLGAAGIKLRKRN